MAGQNTLIIATDYNSIQSNAASVLGVGSGDFGYGQSVASGQVSPSAKISLNQWTNLRTDILRSRQYQTNTIQTLPVLTNANKVSEQDRAAFAAMASLVVTNRLVIPPPGQSTREILVASQIRTAAWNGTISQTVTINFASATAARNYFNTGSRIEISSSLTGSSGPKYDSWVTILTNMGTIYFNRASTVCTGTGNNSAIGYAQLTTSDQQVFSKDVTGTTYTPNRFVLLARVNSNQLILTLQWRDDSGQPNPPWGTDENVTGSLRSIVEVYRASGANVSVPLPPATTTGIG
jgi:hypothetical protein